jgi:general secretion pathway protein M
MKAWFYALQPRERWLVAFGGVAAAIIIIWGFVVMPLRGEVTRLRASVETKQRLLIDIARVESEQPSTVDSNRLGANRPLYALVDETVGAYGLEPPRTRQNGPSGVDVTFQNASFDALVAWLVALRTTYGVDVETASFSSAREPGLVNGQLSLQRL